ncbi:7-carboxy-7-deazaguanine synthase QueE [Labilibacter marinus]|uniref:7-carboxy-7-deazaguanine synthase QueE n=1 Tax=Labilibacter marinus TaxID=1477105 RepID=UPI001E459273|nr:7-carboxy-7-deazaguanine synthase QueE [Labilibacter marinus]
MSKEKEIKKQRFTKFSYRVMDIDVRDKAGVDKCSSKDTAKLVLVGEGVFPITKDAEGKHINDCPQTGLQIAGTIQGEGKLAGTPSLFIRLASCNLRCIWQMVDGSFCRCDTSYASFHPDDKKTWDIAEIVLLVKHNIGEMQHVVITGGEPLLQKNGVTELCKAIKQELDLHITIETNGTLYDEKLTQFVDLFSISPKLSNSVPSSEKLTFYKEEETGASRYHHEVRRNIPVLQNYIDSAKDLQLKFVVGMQSDADEIISDYLNVLERYNKQDIMLMPLGATHEQIEQSNPIVLQLCIQNGWKYTPRIHIEIFGSKQGV